MSIVRNRKMKKDGITDKTDQKKAREYIRSFTKCNRGYAYNNVAFNIGKQPDFLIQSSCI